VAEEYREALTLKSLLPSGVDAPEFSERIQVADPLAATV
jgi:hypothetical protein